MKPWRHVPDPVALAIAREMQEQLQPAEVILLGSRATGEHRPDSDVDLMAVCPNEETAKEADQTLRQLLEGKYEIPVLNVTTITKHEFRRTAPLAQSQAGQAARHGVTPDGKELRYRPEREPETEEILQATTFWLTLAEAHLDAFTIFSESGRLTQSHLPAFEAQQALERAFKLDFTHFKRHKRGNLQYDGTEWRGVSVHRSWRSIVKNPPTPTTSGYAQR